MVINRALIVLKAKQEAVDWINEVDPMESESPITLENVHEDCTSYLVPEDIESHDHAMVWALHNAEVLLDEFLYGWYQDESLWPENIGPKLFDKWFDVEYHSILIDTVDEPIIKEEM